MLTRAMLRLTCKWTKEFVPRWVFFFQISTVFVFHDQSEDYTGADDITDML